MRDDRRIAEFVANQNVVLFAKPPPLSRPSEINFASAHDRSAAQHKLLLLRKNSKGYKDPAKGVLAKTGLRSKDSIERKNTTFTLNERRDALDEILQNQENVGLAQAVIELDAEKPFDINIRQEGSPQGSRRRSSAGDGVTIPSRWLQLATKRGQKNYISLLASRSPSQQSLDESLKLALEDGLAPIVEELLRYGANPNTCLADFHRLVGNGNTDFTRLLLNSSHAIAQADRNKALLTAVESRSFVMTSQLLAFGADASCSSGRAFTSAAERYDLRLLTLLISASPSVSAESLQSAIDHVCEDTSVEPQTRYFFLELLLSAGARTRPQILFALLGSALQENNSPLVSLLVSHGEISPEHATAAIGLVPQELSEDDILEMSRLLFEAGAQGEALGAFLVSAVERDYRHVVALLVSNGVSLDHDDAFAVRLALQRVDIQLLDLLLNGDGTTPGTSAHTDTILAKALTDALIITDKRRRHQATELLLNKGVAGQALDAALQAAVAKPAIRDIRLIRAFHEAGANFNCSGAQCIKDALKLDATNVLEYICWTGQISQESFGIVLPLAIMCSRHEQSKVRILLRECQQFQNEISKALVEEVRSPENQDEIVRLLLSSGASVNYLNGAVFEETILSTSANLTERLRLFLSKGPDQTALGTTFDAVRKLRCTPEQRFDLFSLILEAGYNGPSRDKALAETIAANPKDTAIPSLLLQHKASVDCDSGRAFALAAKSGNINLLNILMAYDPNAASVKRAFESASKAKIDNLGRHDIFKSLLASGKVSSASVTSALTNEIVQGRTDAHVLDLLTSHRGTLDREAIFFLVRNRNVSLVGHLLRSQTPSKPVLSQVLQFCLDLDRSERLAFASLLVPADVESAAWTAALYRSIQDRDHEFLKMLLAYSSEQNFDAGDALVRAVDTFDPVTVGILLQCGPSPQSRDSAFERMLGSGRMQHTDESRLAAKLILAQGISQHLKDRALLDGLQTFAQHKSDFYKTLIEHRANVNTKACQCFALAGRFESLDVFRYLLQSNPNFDQVVSTLVSEFTGQGGRLVEILRLTLTSEYYHGGVPTTQIIFEAMHRYPREPELTCLLLDHGFPAGDPIELPYGPNGVVEAVTPLIWALSQPRPGISDDVILELLKRGNKARPGLPTDQSQTTAISVGVQHRRHEIIARLIELKVDVSAPDCHDRTPLFYAAANEDIQAVELLLAARARPDDGSLHEAARVCHSGIVATLISDHHDINYPSDLHGGRTALGELCLLANLDSKQAESNAYNTMEMLIGEHTDLTRRIDGKTILHLALTNYRPVEVTKILLRFPEVWKDIRTDSELFLFEDARNICMSPNHFVTEYCTCSDSVKGELQELLRKKHCKSKWYKKRGAQVPNPEGLPPAMKDVQDREDLADQAEHRAIARRKMHAKAELEIENQRHQAKLKQNSEQTAAELTNRARIHQQEMEQDSALSSQRRYHANLERKDQQSHRERMAQIEYNATEGQNQLRLKALEKESEVETRAIGFRDEADQKAHNRAMSRFERQQETIRLAASEQKRMIEAAKAAKVESSPLMLGYDVD